MTAQVDTTDETRTVEANGLSIGYSIRGSGPPLLLIHGAEAGLDMFSAFGAELASHFTVIAYDQRDTGSTRDLTEPPRSYGLADLADDAAGLIKALGLDRVHVFGTSLGGTIAQALASRHPGCVDRLILACTFVAGESLMKWNPQTAQQLGTWRLDPVRHAPDIALKFFTPEYLRAHPQRIDMFRGSRRTPEQAARRAGLMGSAFPIAKHGIAANTLLLMAEKDVLIPHAASLAVAPLLREHRTAVVAGVGHIAAIEAPAALARAVTTLLAS